MNKIQSLPDVASLVLRVVLGVGYLQLVYPMISGFSEATGWLIVLAVVSIALFLVGSLFIIFGLWTRWVTILMVAYFIVLTVIVGWGVLLQKLIEIIILAAIWFIGSGKYSVDHKLAMRKLATRVE